MNAITRRQMLRSAGAAALALPALHLPSIAWAADEKTGLFTLPKLPYAVDALEPHIDAKTMEIHHGRHHQAYIDNLNKALAKHPDLKGKSLDALLGKLADVPDDIRTAVRNNGGGHANHTLFWEIMGPKAGGEPKGELGKALSDSFGGSEGFQKALTDAAMTQFGSGWAWLVVKGGKLDVVKSANQDTPVMTGLVPLLGVDVWEHAYYLKYQNKRADYVKAWFNVINWDAVAERYNAAKKG